MSESSLAGWIRTNLQLLSEPFRYDSLETHHLRASRFFTVAQIHLSTNMG